MADQPHVVLAARWLIGNRVGMCPNRWYWLLFGKGARRPDVPLVCQQGRCGHDATGCPMVAQSPEG
jgi:hypothetical protein